MTERGSTAPAEAALLALCAAPDGDHSARFAELCADDWDRLVAMAEEQRASPLLRRTAGHDRLPAHVALQLDAVVLRQAQEVLCQRAALEAILRTLADAGMAPVALKGLRLAWRDYPEPVLRPLRDLDLLLTPGEAEHAQALLLASGDYARLDDARRYGIEHGHQLPELVDRRHGVTIELHHRLNARGWRDEAGLVAMMRDDHEALDLGGGLVVRVPSAHANFLHLVEHATLHHLFDNGPLVLADLHFAAISGELDWPRLLGEAESLGLTRALRLIAGIAARYSATWLPRALSEGPAADPAHVALGEAALLRSDADRRDIALLRRLEQRTGARPGFAAGMRAALQPGSSALAGVVGTSPRSPLRWLGYPLWLLRRVAAYVRAGDRATRTRAADHVGLHAWLHGR